MLYKTPPQAQAKLLTPVMLAIMAALAKQSRTPTYHTIGQSIPGIARKVKGLEWVHTGNDTKINKLGKPITIKTGFYSDTRLSKATRMVSRVRKGLPAHA